MPRAIYPSRKCLSPDCPNGEFVPERSDKKVCDDICRSRYHSQRKREANKTKYKQIEEIKKADNALKELYKTCQDKNIETVSAETLTLLNISTTSALSILVDSETGFKIFWFHEYGIMGIAKDKYKIRKKSLYVKI